MALTYASRTQHHVLARNISDLIQHKVNEVTSDSETETEDVAYMESRTSTLKQRVQLRNGANTGMSSSKQAMSSLRIKAPTITLKSDQHKQKSGRFLTNANSTTSTNALRPGEKDGVPNETKELFSDGEEDVGGKGEGEGEGEGGEGEGREGDSEGETQVATALETKRANPFKVSLHKTPSPQYHYSCLMCVS